MHINRRTAIGALVSSALLPWLHHVKNARAQAPKVQHGARTAQGKAAILKYREAVSLLKSRQRHDPASWHFQANTHWYPRTENLEEIFSTVGASPAEAQKIEAFRALALGGSMDGQNVEGVWRTCLHSSSSINYDFLPWHRAYLLCIETLIESAIGEPFAMPYWDYTVAPLLPTEFRQPSNNTNALYHEQRLLNDDPALPIGAADASSSLSQEQFGFFDVTALGFSLDLESNLHGTIHVFTGTAGGMADPSYAARDPIFYLHHSAIDRLWESWRRNITDPDPSDSAWLARTHRFIGVDGAPMTWSTQQILDIQSLGYEYDTYEEVLVASNELRPFGLGATLEIANSRGQVGGVLVVSAPVEVPLSAAELPFDAKRLTEQGRFVLTLENVSAQTNPGVGYRVYFNIKSDAPPEEKAARFAGFFNLFGLVEGHGEHGAGGKTVTIDVTPLVGRGVIEPPTTQEEFDKFANAVSDKAAFTAALQLIDFSNNQLLSARFMAPKIVDVTGKPPYDSGWRKILRIQARAGSAAKTAGIGSGFILFNYLRPQTDPAPFPAQGSNPDQASKNNQVMLIAEPGAPNLKDSAYWAVYDSKENGYRSAYFLAAVFDLPDNPQTDGKYYVPRACADCHGHVDGGVVTPGGVQYPNAKLQLPGYRSLGGPRGGERLFSHCRDSCRNSVRRWYGQGVTRVCSCI